MSSTSLFGVLGEFDPSTELFVAYLERAGNNSLSLILLTMQC